MIITGDCRFTDIKSDTTCQSKRQTVYSIRCIIIIMSSRIFAGFFAETMTINIRGSVL